jgi:hypothetical protein
MKLNKTLTALAVSASFGLSGQAFAAGTAAGSTVTNTVSLDYAVSGTQQASESATVDFKVDHKINFVVDKVGAEQIISSGTQPGSTVQYTFRVINNGNGHVDFNLNLIDEALNTSLTSVVGSPLDNVTFETISLFWDEDKDGTNNSGAENKVFIDALTFDDSGTDNIANVIATVKLYELSPANAAFYNDLDTSDGIRSVAGLIGGLTLEAKAAANEVAGVPVAAANGSLGTVYTSDDRDDVDTAGVDLVFADLANGAADNLDAYTGAIEISTSQLSVVKTMKVLNDFITTNPLNAKAIPGAQIEYTITVENIGNSATAVDGSGVSYTIADDLTAIAAIDNLKAIAITVNGGANTETVDANLDSTNGDIKLEFNTPLASGATNTVKFTVFIK